MIFLLSAYLDLFAFRNFTLSTKRINGDQTIAPNYLPHSCIWKRVRNSVAIMTRQKSGCTYLINISCRCPSEINEWYSNHSEIKSINFLQLRITNKSPVNINHRCSTSYQKSNWFLSRDKINQRSLKCCARVTYKYLKKKEKRKKWCKRYK